MAIVFILFAFTSPCVFAQEKASGSSATLISIRAQKDPLATEHKMRVLEAFLEKYDSPLAPSAKSFVNSAETHDLDFRLVAAISGVESTFGKQCPTNSYNCWGWGIYGDNMIYFKSYNEAIETISKGIRERYINQWKAETVYDIGRYYAASPTWAIRVDYFMNQIAAFEVNNPDIALSISL